MKALLVGTDGSRYSEVAAEYGLYLAHGLSVPLEAVHVLDSRMLEGPMMADISGWIGAQPYGNQLNEFREMLEKRGQAVVEAFNARCVDAGLPASGVVRMGHPARVLLEEGRDAGLLIVGQRGIHADLLGDALGSTVERVTRHSAVPCLVTPAQFDAMERILVAYDGSEPAERALSMAIDWARALTAELLVVTAADHHDGHDADQVARQGRSRIEAAQLPVVHTVVEHRRADEAILETAAAEGCSLIAMGAYGHGRVRELLLGSITSHVLSGSTVAVLLTR